MIVPEKGDLVILGFDPQSGHEKSGVRPAIVLSPKKFNQITNFSVVCPITRQSKNYPFEVELPDGLAIEGVILTDQVKSIDRKSRSLKIKGQAPPEIVEKCIERIHTYLYI